MTGLLLIRFQAGETDLMTRAGIFEPRRRPLFELKGEALRRELSECELKGEALRRELSECAEARTE